MDLLEDISDVGLLSLKNAPSTVTLERLFEILENIKDSLAPVVFQYHLDQMTQFMNNAVRKKQLKLLHNSKKNAKLSGNAALAQACNQEMQMLCDYMPSNVSLMSMSRRQPLHTSVLQPLAEERQYSREGSVVGSLPPLSTSRLLQPTVQLSKLQNHREGALEKSIRLLREPSRNTREAEGRLAITGDAEAREAEAREVRQLEAREARRPEAREARETSHRGCVTIGRGKGAHREEERGRDAGLRQNVHAEELGGEQCRGDNSAIVSGRGRPPKRISASRTKSSERGRGRPASKTSRRSKSWGTPADTSRSPLDPSRASRRRTAKDAEMQPQRSLFLDKLQTKYLPLVSDSPDPFSSASPKDLPMVKKRKRDSKENSLPKKKANLTNAKKADSGKRKRNSKGNSVPKKKPNLTNAKKGSVSEDSESYVETPKSSRHSALGRSASRKLVRSRAVLNTPC